MRKNIILILCSAVALALSACYDDNGGNDYDSSMPNVRIQIPEVAYSGGLGETVNIKPSIQTDISEDDLQYFWEVKGEIKNEFGNLCYRSLLPDSLQSRDLNYVCKLDSNVTSLNRSYECRLRVHQKSTGRDFYSENTFTLTIAGVTGLMVLHGTDESCDVGILEAPEFIPAANSLPDTLKAMPHFYSGNNDGAILQGRGEEIVQSLSTYLYNDELRQRSRIYVKTDKGVTWLNKDDLSRYGNWDDMFYLKGDDKVNDGDPKGYIVMPPSAWIAFDGDDMFYMQPSGAYPYLFPECTPTTRFSDGNTFTLAPACIKVDDRGIQCLMYANTVNGKDKKGFIAVSTSMTEGFYYFSALMDTKGDNVVFNPGDMHASLVTMRGIGNGHCMAVLRGDTDHPTYAGQYFAVDLAPNIAAPDGSATPYAGAARNIYSIATLTDIDNAISFEFGSTQNMNYYATPSGVYNYHVDGSTLYPAQMLQMADGGTLSIDGQVTMMKMLNSPNVTTRITDPILLVATYDGQQSALYALYLDTMTGMVNKSVKYSADNVVGWNFGRISDVNIKGL